MLFAWADDFATTSEIIKLNDQDGITAFLDSQTEAIFVIDQMNALRIHDFADEKTVYNWILNFTSEKKRVFSCSANYSTFLEQSKKENQDRVMNVYGGLSRVSSLILSI
jgi:hypothetical protein